MSNSSTNNHLHSDPLWLAIQTISAMRIDEKAIGASVNGGAPHDTDYFDAASCELKATRTLPSWQNVNDLHDGGGRANLEVTRASSHVAGGQEMSLSSHYVSLQRCRERHITWRSLGGHLEATGGPPNAPALTRHSQSSHSRPGPQRAAAHAAASQNRYDNSHWCS